MRFSKNEEKRNAVRSLKGRIREKKNKEIRKDWKKSRTFAAGGGKRRLTRLALEEGWTGYSEVSGTSGETLVFTSIDSNKEERSVSLDTSRGGGKGGTDPGNTSVEELLSESRFPDLGEEGFELKGGVSSGLGGKEKSLATQQRERICKAETLLQTIPLKNRHLLSLKREKGRCTLERSQRRSLKLLVQVERTTTR